MSDSRRDPNYLLDILEATRRIMAYTDGMTYEEFLEDIKTQDAVLRNMQVIGEAVKKLSNRIKKAHPEIP